MTALYSTTVRHARKQFAQVSLSFYEVLTAHRVNWGIFLLKSH